MKKLGHALWGLGHALRRVSNEYRDADAYKGTGEYTVTIIAGPLERDESERVADQIAANERVERQPTRPDSDLHEQKLFRIRIDAVNMANAGAAAVQCMDIVRQALHDLDLAPKVEYFLVEVHEPDEAPSK